MVNQTEQPIENSETPVDTGNTTTDITEEFSGKNTFEDVSAPPADDINEPSSSEGQDTQPKASSPGNAPPSVEEAVPADTPPVPSANPVDQLSMRNAQLEQQVAQNQQVQIQTQLQQSADQYRQNLEQQGYLPDQAQQVAQQWAAGKAQEFQAYSDQQYQLRSVEGKYVAAETYVQKHNLDVSDMAELRRYNDPQSMEAAAIRLKSDREKDAEIARLKAQLVPSQTFDDSQSTPAASTSEDNWLDRYNQGDRSDQAKSAARRAAGLG